MRSRFIIIRIILFWQCLFLVTKINTGCSIVFKIQSWTQSLNLGGPLDILLAYIQVQLFFLLTFITSKAKGTFHKQERQDDSKYIVFNSVFIFVFCFFCFLNKAACFHSWSCGSFIENWICCCLLLSPQAAMCYVHVAALVAEYLHRKSKACRPSTNAHTQNAFTSICGLHTLYTVMEYQSVSGWLINC